jgi:membrane protease subunit HflC
MAINRMIIAVPVIFILFSSCYVIQEGQRAIVLRLGDIVKAEAGPRIDQPGLHFKWPFVDQAKIFDVRLQTFEEKSSRILTKEQKYVLVDYYVKWRITDLSLFFKRTEGAISKTEQLISQKVNDVLRAAFGERTITEVVSGERENIMMLLRQETNDSAKNLGLVIVDVRIKRIDLPSEVSHSVFQRMSADRERVATKHRSDGRAVAESIQAKADAESVVIIAKAREKAALLKAKGDADAATIYNQAYLKDPGFYRLYRSLAAYEHTFKDADDLIVLQPKSTFFNYFKKYDLLEQ